MSNKNLILVVALVLLVGFFCSGCGSDDDSQVGPALVNIPGKEVALEPSASAQVVSLDNLSVTVPGGLLAQTTTLSILPKVAAAISPLPTSGLQSLGAFEVKLGNNSQFAQNLTLEWQYDPAKLSQDLPEGEGVVVCYYDENIKRWVEVPFTVDKTNKKLVVSTNHLSAWVALFWPYHSAIPSPKKYFEVYYNSRHAVPIKDYASWTDFVTMVGTDLDAAYEKYSSMGFTMPATPIYAVIDESEDASASSGFFSSRMILPRGKLTTRGLVRNETAHELFHLVQYKIHSMTSLYYTGYWIAEGTPDFAALQVWPEERETILKATEFGYISGFFESPLWKDSIPEAYCLVFFLDYLKKVANYDVNLKTLWDEFSSSGNAALTKHVANISGLDFAKVWENYLDYSFLNEASPLIRDWQHQTLGVDIRDLNITLPPYSAKAQVFRNSEGTKVWIASPTSIIPDGVSVDLSHRDGSSTGKELTRTRLANIPIKTAMSSKQTLIVLFKNTTAETKTVSVSLRDDDFLAKMQQMTYSRAELYTMQIFSQTQKGGLALTRYRDCYPGLNVGPDYSYASGVSGHPTITWTDTNFAVSHSKDGYTYSISGTVDPAKRTVTASFRHSIVWPTLTSVYFVGDSSESYTAEETWSYEINSIPVTVELDANSVVFEIKGGGASQHVGNLSVIMHPNPSSYGDWLGADWSGTVADSSKGTTAAPNLKLTFWKK